MELAFDICSMMPTSDSHGFGIFKFSDQAVGGTLLAAQGRKLYHLA